jgi:hypothetical protein
MQLNREWLLYWRQESARKAPKQADLIQAIFDNHRL